MVLLERFIRRELVLELNNKDECYANVVILLLKCLKTLKLISLVSVLTLSKICSSISFMAAK
jgi:hypothetical protein